MKIAAYLMVTLLAVLHQSEGTFRRHHKNQKNKGPFGGHLVSWGSTALDGFLRYAPDFYDVVPKVAHKLLTGGKKHREHYYDDDEYPLISAGKRTMKRINRILNKPHHGGHVVPVPSYPLHHSYGGNVVPVPSYPLHYGGHGVGGLGSLGGFDDFGFGGYGYGHQPLVIPHGSFDELPVHGVFHDPIDFSTSLGSFSHDLHNFDHGYHL